MTNSGWCISAICFAILLGLIPAFIAHRKGHSFWMWWVGGAFMFIIVLPLAIVEKPNPEELERRRLSSRGFKPCPYCAERIRERAVVCRYCGRELPSTSPEDRE